MVVIAAYANIDDEGTRYPERSYLKCTHCIALLLAFSLSKSEYENTKALIYRIDIRH